MRGLRVRSARPDGARPAARTSRARPADAGQITVLALGFAALSLALVLVVAAATSVQLQRTRLLDLADSTALAAADSLDPAGFYGGAVPEPGPAGGLALTDGAVRAAAERHLAAAGERGRFTDLALASADAPDGRTAEVTLAARARLPLVGWALQPWADGVPLVVTSRARAW